MLQFPQNFMNHIKSDPSGDVFNQDASKQKTSSYPSVDGLPKYSQTNQLQFMVKNVIKSMMNHKYASPFARPVDKKIYMVGIFVNVYEFHGIVLCICTRS